MSGEAMYNRRSARTESIIRCAWPPEAFGARRANSFLSGGGGGHVCEGSVRQEELISHQKIVVCCILCGLAHHRSPHGPCVCEYGPVAGLKKMSKVPRFTGCLHRSALLGGFWRGYGVRGQLWALPTWNSSVVAEVIRGAFSSGGKLPAKRQKSWGQDQHEPWRNHHGFVNALVGGVLLRDPFVQTKPGVSSRGPVVHRASNTSLPPAPCPKLVLGGPV